MQKKPVKKRKSTRSTITLQERVFADRYIINNGNGREAAEYAGYSPRSAKEQASKLLDKPHIAAYIKERTDKLFDKFEITQERVYAQLARIGFSDIRSVFNEIGRLKDIKDLDDDAAAALASVETDELWGRDEEGDKTQVGVTRKVRLWDKLKALEQIVKMKGWNAPEQHEHKGEITIGYGKEE